MPTPPPTRDTGKPDFGYSPRDIQRLEAERPEYNRYPPEFPKVAARVGDIAYDVGHWIGWWIGYFLAGVILRVLRKRFTMAASWAEACSDCKGYPPEISGGRCTCSWDVRLRRWARRHR